MSGLEPHRYGDQVRATAAVRAARASTGSAIDARTWAEVSATAYTALSPSACDSRRPTMVLPTTATAGVPVSSAAAATPGTTPACRDRQSRQPSPVTFHRARTS